jgi:glycosyltransferase involved in cell wall biosynthesis
MRIGLCAYLLHYGRNYRSAGVSTYVRQLLVHLPLVRPQHDFLAFHGRDALPVPGVQSVLSPVPTYRPPVRIAWEQVGLPIQSRLHSVDLLHGTVNVLPVLERAPGVVTVHDLSFLRHPDRFLAVKVAYLGNAVGWSVRRARRVITVSEHTRADVVELLGIPPDRVRVVHHGVDPSFRPLTEADTEAFRRDTFGGRPYLLHVGTLEPRKNLDVLIGAFAELRRSRAVPHVLALVGARGWMYQRLFEQVARLELEREVRFVDYVPPERLPLWYNCADLFAYPSAYEGFGLPLLEAMACGVPCITSASSALQELAAGACLTVAPGSQEALHVAMAQVLDDAALRARMREAGLARARGFSWEQTACRTARVYEEAAEDARA